MPDAADSLRLTHCPECRYDMRGNPDADRCPECGEPYRSWALCLNSPSRADLIIACCSVPVIASLVIELLDPQFLGRPRSTFMTILAVVSMIIFAQLGISSFWRWWVMRSSGVLHERLLIGPNGCLHRRGRKHRLAKEWGDVSEITWEPAARIYRLQIFCRGTLKPMVGMLVTLDDVQAAAVRARMDEYLDRSEEVPDA